MITMIIAYRNFSSVGNCFLSPLYYGAEKNPGNHLNLINHSSDKIPLLLKPPFITEQKIITAIIVIPLIIVQTKNHGNHYNPINPGSGSDEKNPLITN
jgi:hypothetical protein